MKVGIRKPSLKKSLSARTTGKVKRKFKRLANPFYGKKGMGWVKNPKKALYNKIYRKTTISTKNLIGCLSACIYYPLYWSFILIYWCCILMWWMVKYAFLILWWFGVMVVNMVIALIEWIVNRNANVDSDKLETIPKDISSEVTTESIE